MKVFSECFCTENAVAGHMRPAGL